MDDLCWLLSRGYGHPAAHALVSNRYRLRDRQRRALQRCAASDEERRRRLANRVSADGMAGRTLIVDGFNVLLTLEAALSGGVLLLARDTTLRDLSSLDRHYRQTETTRPALELVGSYLEALDVRAVSWVLDRPVSNSVRLSRRIEETAEANDWPWKVERVEKADAYLRRSEHVVASADSQILDGCRDWLNLARQVVEHSIVDGWIVEL